jgi:hypothetical protein
VELVDARRRLERRASASSGDGDVDGGRNGVDQAVASERALQAQRGVRDALGNLDQIGVGGRRIGPAVDATAERDDLSAVAQGVQTPVTDTCLLGLAVGERVTQLLSEIRDSCRPRGRKSYSDTAYLGRVSFKPGPEGVPSSQLQPPDQPDGLSEDWPGSCRGRHLMCLTTADQQPIDDA